ncbi:MAG TPA: type II toxin-antitoxin system Phd/YefM family antitoxin [Pirellulales bacterium]|nr:type II toxin-antitoxin system Phd/YefM family antitoxin [Pirellulales bacterium]
MKVASQQQVAANFAEYVKASQKGPVVVTKNGEPVAVLLKAKGKDDVERLLMGHSAKLQSILQAARERFAEGHGIPHETFWKEMAAEVEGRSVKRRRPPKSGRTKR